MLRISVFVTRVLKELNKIKKSLTKEASQSSEPWQQKGLSNAQILRLSRKKRADTLISENIRAVENLGIQTKGKSTKDIFNELRLFLKDPAKLHAFKNIQECLDIHY